MNKEALQVKIRDRRRKQFFIVDNDYLNGYARLCGISATGVYISLCRHANREEKAWPSIQLIAEELSINERTARRAIKTLEEWNIIQAEREKDEKTKRWKGTIYTLTEKSEWKPKPADIKSTGATGLKIHNPPDFNDTSHRTPVHCNNTNKNNTNMKDIDTNVSIQARPVKETYGNEEINWLFDEFNKMMGFASSGKKDRWLAKHLLGAFNKRQIQAMLLYCSTDEFAPRIGSIEKLWYKRGDIIAGIKKFQQKKEKPKLKIGSIPVI